MQATTIRERVSGVVLVYPDTQPWEVKVVGPRGSDSTEVNLLAARMARAAAMRSSSLPVPEGIPESLVASVVKTQYKGLGARGHILLADALAARYDVPRDMLVR